MSYTIGVEPGVDDATTAEFWAVYRASLDPLRTRAAARPLPQPAGRR